MNEHCKCEMDDTKGTLLCTRHQCTKTKRSFEKCKGIASNYSCVQLEKRWMQWEDDALKQGHIKEVIPKPKGLCKIQKRTRSLVSRRRTLPRGGKSIIDSILPEHIQCPYLGNEVRITKCTTCGSRGKPLPVYACTYEANKSGECTISKKHRDIYSCQTCPIGRELFNNAFDSILKEPKDGHRISTQLLKNYVPPNLKPLSDKPTKSLAFHLYPISGGIWKWHIDQIAKYQHIFNGKIIIAIVIDTITSHDEAKEYILENIPNAILSFHTNNPALREGVTFPHLLREVLVDDPNSIFFYAQGKGVRVDSYDTELIKQWCSLMYQLALDYMPLTLNMLDTYPLVGSFRCREAFKHAKSFIWHYSGTYFWGRSQDILSRNYTHLINKWWCVEAWPGQLVSSEHSGVLFMDNLPKSGGLYKKEYWDNYVLPNWEEFKKKYKSFRTN